LALIGPPLSRAFLNRVPGQNAVAGVKEEYTLFDFFPRLVNSENDV